MTLNHRLKQARELRGWSQAKIAEKLGTDATTVSRWERGLFSPTPFFRERLCKLFGQNAEELGLLETTDQRISSSAIHSPIPMPSFQTSGTWQREPLYVEERPYLLPPSWSKRSDTFSYILHSASYDQQAHMLWSEAYVRAMRGQIVEARQLGEASLTAFERVGHFNASIVREWLDQRQLVSPTPLPANISPIPSTILPEQHKETVRRFAQGKSAGIVLTLLVVMLLVSTGVVLNLFNHAALASPHITTASKTMAATIPSTQLTSTHAVSPAPTAQVFPRSLNPRVCPLEALGYRCTLKIQLLRVNSAQKILWSASSSNIFVQFNPSKGLEPAGKVVQLVAYVQSRAGQKGQLLFTFTFASHLYTTSTSWNS